MKCIFIISDETAMWAKVGDQGHSATLVTKRVRLQSPDGDGFS
jgi:hypothetical protein